MYVWRLNVMNELFILCSVVEFVVCYYLEVQNGLSWCPLCFVKECAQIRHALCSLSLLIKKMKIIRKCRIWDVSVRIVTFSCQI